MKKILLATTALVGFAGAAAAEVSLSGYAEIGIQGGSDVETQFHNDIDVTFTLSGESDSGLSFGATIDLDEEGGFSATNGGPDSVWVSGSFGKVTLGDTDGALDWAVSEIYSGSAINDDHSTHAGAYWNSGLDGTHDGQVMRYEYSFGDFGVAFSAELDDTGVGDAALGLGVKWSGDMGGTTVGVGLGVQDDNVNQVVAVSVSAAMANGFSVNLGYADLDGVQSHFVGSNGFDAFADKWWGLGAAYTSGALTVGVNYGAYDTDIGDVNGWGLVANYDLGGGAVFMAGYGSSDLPTGTPGGSFNGNGDDTFSLGLGLSF